MVVEVVPESECVCRVSGWTSPPQPVLTSRTVQPPARPLWLHMFATSAVSEFPADWAAALVVPLILKASCRLAARSIVVKCTIGCRACRLAVRDYTKKSMAQTELRDTVLCTVRAQKHCTKASLLFAPLHCVIRCSGFPPVPALPRAASSRASPTSPPVVAFPIPTQR